MDNPFERYDLDPREGIAAITARLKELAEDARDDAERDRIRAAWEELTMHPARRLRAALFAHPETRSPLGQPPSLPRRRAPGFAAVELVLRELTPAPSLRLAVGAALDGRPEAEAPPSLDDDPLLDPRIPG